MGSAQVAQLVEHVTENHGVGGSIPPLGTIAGGRSERRRTRPNPTHKAKELAMGRIGWASVVATLFFALASPGFAQTNEACMLRCLDHGNLEQTCEARCTNGVPPAAPLAPNRTSKPAQQSAPQSPAASGSPPVAAAPSGPQPSAQQPAPPLQAVTQPAPQPNVQSVPQPAANQVPSPPTAQASPQQSVRPPAPPVNERCVLLCLDHGHLDQYCDRICALPVPGGTGHAAPPPADGK